MKCSCSHHGLVRNAKGKRHANPLAHDPTRTTTLRNRFVREMKRRFGLVKKAIQEFIGGDSLGLAEVKNPLILNVDPQYAFLTDPAKLAAFNTWLKKQIDLKILSVPPGTDPDRPWTAEYIDSAYKQGIINAYVSSRTGLELSDPNFITQTQADFVRSSFGRPESLLKAKLLATRSFEQLKGVTSSMGSQMNYILAQGMLEGRDVKSIAREMADSIDGLTDSRALKIARTEVISAHAAGQLDSFAKLGIEELGIKAEWQTAGDSRVCPICSAMEGKIFTVAEANGMIPAHPNCRCSWQPYIEPPKK